MASQIQRLCSALQLTATQADATFSSIVGGMSYHTLDFLWTPGTTGNVLSVTIYHRVKEVTDSSWIPDMEWNDNPAGTKVRTLEVLTHTATGVTEVPLSYLFQEHAGEIKIQVSESTAGGATLGTITAYLTSSSS